MIDNGQYGPIEEPEIEAIAIGLDDLLFKERFSQTAWILTDHCVNIGDYR